MIPKLYSDRYTNVKLEFDDVEFPMTQRTCALVMRATKSMWNTYRIVIHDAKFTGIDVLVSFLLFVHVHGHVLCFPVHSRSELVFVITGASYQKEIVWRSFLEATWKQLRKGLCALKLKDAAANLPVGEFASRQGTYDLPPLEGDRTTTAIKNTTICSQDATVPVHAPGNLRRPAAQQPHQDSVRMTGSMLHIRPMQKVATHVTACCA